jgi:hypothetical protein
MKKLLLPAIIFSLLHISITIAQSKSPTLMSLLVLSGKAQFLYLLLQLSLFLFLIRNLKLKYYPTGIDFKQLFFQGMLIAIIYSTIVSIFSFIYLSYIDPEMITITKKLTHEIAIKQAAETGANIEKLEKVMAMVQTPFAMSLSSFFSLLFWGAISSLIAALVFRNRNKNIST